MSELINKPYPVNGESLQSYVCRIAKANHYTFDLLSQHYADRAARFRSYDLADREKIREETQELCGAVDTSGLIDIWKLYKQHKEVLDFSKTKICVDCYREGRESVQAKFWSKHLVSCSAHNKILVDRCSECDTPITFHSLTNGECTNCNFPLKDITADDVVPDMISQQLAEAFKNVSSTSTFEGQLQEFGYPILNKIKLLLPLVNIPELPQDKFWKKRRSLSMNDLYLYQLAISKLLSNPELLEETLFDFIEGSMNGGVSLVNATSSFTRLQDEVGGDFFFDTLKRILPRVAKAFPDMIASVSWLESLLGMMKDELNTCIKTSFPTKFCNGTQKTIYLRDLEYILAVYRK